MRYDDVDAEKDDANAVGGRLEHECAAVELCLEADVARSHEVNERIAAVAEQELRERACGEGFGLESAVAHPRLCLQPEDSGRDRAPRRCGSATGEPGGDRAIVLFDHVILSRFERQRRFLAEDRVLGTVDDEGVATCPEDDALANPRIPEFVFLAREQPLSPLRCRDDSLARRMRLDARAVVNCRPRCARWHNHVFMLPDRVRILLGRRLHARNSLDYWDERNYGPGGRPAKAVFASPLNEVVGHRNRMEIVRIEIEDLDSESLEIAHTLERVGGRHLIKV